MTPSAGMPLGVIPRLTIPPTSWSLSTALIGPNVRPPFVDRATAIAPWGAADPNADVPPGTVFTITPPAYNDPSGPLASIGSPAPLIVSLNPVALGSPCAIR